MRGCFPPASGSLLAWLQSHVHPKDVQRERLQRVKSQELKWKEAEGRRSHVSLTCVTSGKPLTRSGPYFPIPKTKEHSSFRYSYAVEAILTPKPSPTLCCSKASYQTRTEKQARRETRHGSEKRASTCASLLEQGSVLPKALFIWG